MKKEIKERWAKLYKQAMSEFSLPLSESEKMREGYEHAIKEYKQSGKIITYENEPDYVTIAKGKALRTAFERLSDKEKYREEFNRDFKLILDNFTSVTPWGAVVGA